MVYGFVHLFCGFSIVQPCQNARSRMFTYDRDFFIRRNWILKLSFCGLCGRRHLHHHSTIAKSEQKERISCCHIKESSASGKLSTNQSFKEGQATWFKRYGYRTDTYKWYCKSGEVLAGWQLKRIIHPKKTENAINDCIQWLHEVIWQAVNGYLNRNVPASEWSHTCGPTQFLIFTGRRIAGYIEITDLVARISFTSYSTRSPLLMWYLDGTPCQIPNRVTHSSKWTQCLMFPQHTIAVRGHGFQNALWHTSPNMHASITPQTLFLLNHPTAAKLPHVYVPHPCSWNSGCWS